MAKNQTELAGMEAPNIPEIEDAASEYVKIRDKRMKLTEQEIAAKCTLLETMRKHSGKLTENGNGEKIYQFDDEIVLLQPGKENVKVKHASALETSDED